MGEVGVARRSDSLDLLLHLLAAHDVLVSRQVAHDVEVLEAVELGEQVAATPGLVTLVARGGRQGVGDVRTQLAVGVEVKRLGLDDGLRAVAAATAGAAAIAAALARDPRVPCMRAPQRSQ